MDEEEKRYLDRLMAKIDLQTKILASEARKDLSFSEKVEWLSALGLHPKDIGEALGVTTNSVRITKTRLKGGKKRGKKETDQRTK